MNFRDFLEVAESVANGDSEAQWRSAASRAYYAAFYVASDFLKELGFQVPRMERAHAYAWLRISNSSVKEINDAGNDLNLLRSARNRADYDGGKSFSQKQAAFALDSAQAIITALDQIVDDSARKAIQEAIKTYERDIIKEVTWKPT